MSFGSSKSRQISSGPSLGLRSVIRHLDDIHMSLHLRRIVLEAMRVLLVPLFTLPLVPRCRFLSLCDTDADTDGNSDDENDDEQTPPLPLAGISGADDTLFDLLIALVQMSFCLFGILLGFIHEWFLRLNQHSEIREQLGKLQERLLDAL